MAESKVALFESDPAIGANGGARRQAGGQPTPVVPILREVRETDHGSDPEGGPTTTELEFDDPMLADSYEHTETEDASPGFDGELSEDEYDEDDEYVDLSEDRATRGRLKARKVRRVVRYVSPWSVLKVSLLFYACLWIIVTIASVILWRLAVETGGITNVEKFVARLFGEKSFTIDGREIFRASTIAGVILVFAGTGFTVLMSLLFNVICDVTGGVRFTVLELESTKRRRRRRKA